MATYVNKWLLSIRFALCSDIINHQDINLLVFHNNWDVNFIINIYLDNNQIALHCLCLNIRDVENTVIITGDFNIRDSNWDPNFHNYSAHTDDLITITDSLGLELSPFLNPSLTRYTDNPRNTNSVLDLVFLSPSNSGFEQYSFYPEMWKPLDYISLIIEVEIKEVNVDITIWSIKKDSDDEKEFVRATGAQDSRRILRD